MKIVFKVICIKGNSDCMNLILRANISFVIKILNLQKKQLEFAFERV